MVTRDKTLCCPLTELLAAVKNMHMYCSVSWHFAYSKRTLSSLQIIWFVCNTLLIMISSLEWIGILQLLRVC